MPGRFNTGDKIAGATRRVFPPLWLYPLLVIYRLRTAYCTAPRKPPPIYNRRQTDLRMSRSTTERLSNPGNRRICEISRLISESRSRVDERVRRRLLRGVVVVVVDVFK